MLNISNIQHFSVGDGAGIRTTVFFKGCNLRCPWCHNPENLTAEPVCMKYTAINKSEVCGRKVLVEEIMPELLEDFDFFVESGGGVTFSGGEVMLQACEASELAKALKEKGVSVLIDTAGSVPYSTFARMNEYADGYLYDIKTADEQKYREIGADPEKVVGNLKRLMQEGRQVQVRIPLIPGFNTDEKSVSGICMLLKGIGVESVDLLPFHRLGSSKYEALGLEYAYKDCQPIPKEKLEEIKKQYSAYFAVNTEH